MHSYPINLNLSGKRCGILGGGAVAERKARDILAAGGEVLVISPEITAGLLAMAGEKKLIWEKRAYRPGDVEDFFLFICAANDAEINLAAALEAKTKKILVDAADNTPLSDFSVPAKVRRGNLLITVSTGGLSPALAREIKEEVADTYGEEYALYLDLMAEIRADMKKKLPDIKDREGFWRRKIDKDALRLLKAGKIDEAKELLAGRIKNEINCLGVKS